MTASIVNGLARNRTVNFGALRRHGREVPALRSPTRSQERTRRDARARFGRNDWYCLRCRIPSGGGATGKGCSKMLAGCGVVYKVDSSGHETVLYAFTGGYDGNQPEGALILDAQGSLYGAAGLGPGLGLIFKIDPAGSVWSNCPR